MAIDPDRALLLDRYARALGIDPAAPPEPTLESLRSLVHQHFFRIPFENVSVLTALLEPGPTGDVFTMERFIDGIENHDQGGTCFGVTPYLLELLKYLGYQADLLLADIWSKRSGRGLGWEHCVIKATFGERSYLVDVGFAAPFYDPVPMDFTEPVRVPHGAISYEFTRGDPPLAAMLVARRGEEPLYRYDVHPEVRDREFFYRERIRGDFRPGKAKFLAQLSIIRFSPEEVLEVRNATLIRTRGEETSVTKFESFEELEACVHRELAMPRIDVRAAVDILRDRCGLTLF